jgi:N utilization substance protein B
MKSIEEDNFRVPKLYKDAEDKDFVKDLFRKTVLNEAALAKEFEDKTPNWDSDRIVEVDTIILKWLFASFKIPISCKKSTLNEYLEIAKEYSTQK